MEKKLVEMHKQFIPKEINAENKAWKNNLEEIKRRRAIDLPKWSPFAV